ncbi:hypothetical protein NLG97_g4803 [Lecanicillium saksenae]|uniref:Uncharacterized protein n=1 Tax=Lecanicillium saksenae TaxID=468837 RepID=A0ACC1QVX3_9HYPO|nr:hypothetical protein NLG97_g4803 [Lecanicillium saksenae]
MAQASLLSTQATLVDTLNLLLGWLEKAIGDVLLRLYNRESSIVLNGARLITLSFALLAVFSFIGRDSSPRVDGAPFEGYRSVFEPTFWLRGRFTTGGYSIIENGYKKFNNIPFVIRRYDTDITILPIKYLDELRLVPKSKLNGKIAQVKNLVPKWTGIESILDSDLHANVLNAKLNPNLLKYVDIAHGELQYGWSIDVPQPEAWKLVDIQQPIRMLVARMSAKVFMGVLASREEEWLTTSINFTYDLFQTAFTMRMFPPWLHPIVAIFVAARWRIRKHLQVAEKMITGFAQQRDSAIKNGEEPEDTLLGWMMDNATETERAIPDMAVRQCVLTLASIHTTAMSVSNLLFDLCTYPEWFSVLRHEIDEVIKVHGKIGESPLNAKLWLAKLEKMDSLIVESQRVNPPVLLSPQRIALVPLTLKDGTKIPAGAKVAWASYHHANDPRTIGRPEKFDPMRSYRKRHLNNGANATKFIAGQTDINSLSFGYGNQSCPGRYFAVSEIKMILMRLLVEFEFRLPEGKARPKTMYVDENVYIDPKAKLIIKRRHN